MLASASNLSCGRNRNSSVGLGLTGSVNFLELTVLRGGHRQSEIGVSPGYIETVERVDRTFVEGVPEFGYATRTNRSLHNRWLLINE